MEGAASESSIGVIKIFINYIKIGSTEALHSRGGNMRLIKCTTRPNVEGVRGQKAVFCSLFLQTVIFID